MFFISACALCASVCLWSSVIVKEKLREKMGTKVIVILPSFLLKSLQFIFLFCQGGLQVQVASIVGQLKGTVISLDREDDTVKHRFVINPFKIMSLTLYMCKEWHWEPKAFCTKYISNLIWSEHTYRLNEL